MSFILVDVQNLDVRSPRVQNMIEAQFTRTASSNHSDRLSETILNEVVLRRRIGRASLFFCQEEIYAVSHLSLGECAQSLDDFWKWARKEASASIAMEVWDKGDVSRASGVISTIMPVLTFMLGALVAGILLKTVVGVAVLAGVVLYYFRSDLAFRILKRRYSKKWR